MENEKYYTPDIEEFHVGFEYEEYDDTHDDFTDEKPIYKKAICDKYLEIQHIILDQVRVKHLDREDIESLGWENSGQTAVDEEQTDWAECWTVYVDETEDKEKYFRILTHQGKVLISFVESHNSVGFSESCLFHGTIRNASELRKIMKMLNIQTT